MPNMYADDACVTIASENLNDQITDLKDELENISELDANKQTWCECKQLYKRNLHCHHDTPSVVT